MLWDDSPSLGSCSSSSAMELPMTRNSRGSLLKEHVTMEQAISKGRSSNCPTASKVVSSRKRIWGQGIRDILDQDRARNGVRGWGQGLGFKGDVLGAKI